ncbi:MAG: hypothetical protein HYX63_06265 [Gammaproteobacteria bacterium]|nr:hypothetical protein [Gammaproteobacteria bacterium]
MTKTIRTTHLVLGMHLPGLDPAKSQRSMELFAKEVVPASPLKAAPQRKSDGPSSQLREDGAEI